MHPGADGARSWVRKERNNAISAPVAGGNPHSVQTSVQSVRNGRREGVLPDPARLVSDHSMSLQSRHVAIVEPPVRPSIPTRDRAAEREPLHGSDLALLRERIKRMRMPRGELLPRAER